jgi:hypothetical protein
MAGQLTIDTLKASSGVLATQNGMTGIAKAWGSYAYASSSGQPTLNSAFNISSLTQTSQGSYSIAFTTAMPNANYAVTFGGSAAGSAQGIIFNIVSKSTSGFTMFAGYPNNTSGDIAKYSWAPDFIVVSS